MKRLYLTILIFFFVGFLVTNSTTHNQYVNVIKYVTEENTSHLEVITPSNINNITVDVFDENKQMSHSISLVNPVLKSTDNAKNSNNVFYITKDSAAFNRFNKLIIYSDLVHPQYFEFNDLNIKEIHVSNDMPVKRSGIKELKIMSYNIHHGKSLLGRYTLDEIANIIEESGADIIGLQEVDSNFVRSKFQNQLKYLADKLSMNYAYGDNVNIVGAKYGNGILSKYPIESYENLKLPSGKEQRGLLAAVIDIDGNKINFLNTHLGLTSSERLVQVNTISKYIDTLLGEVILVGDFNDVHRSRSVHEMTKKLSDIGYITNNSRVPTFEVALLSKRIDYIFISKNIKANKYKVIRSNASDHYPIVADVKITE